MENTGKPKQFLGKILFLKKKLMRYAIWYLIKLMYHLVSDGRNSSFVQICFTGRCCEALCSSSTVPYCASHSYLYSNICCPPQNSESQVSSESILLAGLLLTILFFWNNFILLKRSIMISLNLLKNSSAIL